MQRSSRALAIAVLSLGVGVTFASCSDGESSTPTTATGTPAGTATATTTTTTTTASGGGAPDDGGLGGGGAPVDAGSDAEPCCDAGPHATCGNGRLDSQEPCDGALFDDVLTSCDDNWLGSGEVACTARCTLDFSGCELTDYCQGL